MIERVTPEARQALVVMTEYAKQAGERTAESPYLLLALLKVSADVVGRLRSAGVDVERLETRLSDHLGPWTPFRAGSRGRPGLARDTKLVLEGGLRAAVRLGDGCIASRHLVLGMVSMDTKAGRTLTAACLDVGALTHALSRPPDADGTADAAESAAPSGPDGRRASVMDRFTDEAKGVLVVMRSLAAGVGAHRMNTRHLLLALLRASPDIASRLRSAGVDEVRLEERLWHELGTFSETIADERLTRGQLPFSADLTVAFEAIPAAAARLGDDHIESRHLVLAILAEQTEGRVFLLAELPDPNALHEALARSPGS